MEDIFMVLFDHDPGSRSKGSGKAYLLDILPDEKVASTAVLGAVPAFAMSVILARKLAAGWSLAGNVPVLLATPARAAVSWCAG
jgi:hypothetical protein